MPKCSFSNIVTKVEKKKLGAGLALTVSELKVWHKYRIRKAHGHLLLYFFSNSVNVLYYFNIDGTAGMMQSSTTERTWMPSLGLLKQR